MAIGFQDLGSVQRTPDKNFTKKVEPTVLRIQFGDGYEQRIAEGINSLKEIFNVAFTNRPKAEIDDIIAFFDNKKGTTAFNYTIPDTNAGGNERTVKVVCEDYTQTYVYDDFYSCNATLRRVYEP